jgi:hypothetical protein
MQYSVLIFLRSGYQVSSPITTDERVSHDVTLDFTPLRTYIEHTSNIANLASPISDQPISDGLSDDTSQLQVEPQNWYAYRVDHRPSP